MRHLSILWYPQKLWRGSLFHQKSFLTNQDSVPFLVRRTLYISTELRDDLWFFPDITGRTEGGRETNATYLGNIFRNISFTCSILPLLLLLFFLLLLFPFLLLPPPPFFSSFSSFPSRTLDKICYRLLQYLQSDEWTCGDCNSIKYKSY